MKDIISGSKKRTNSEAICLPESFGAEDPREILGAVGREALWHGIYVDDYLARLLAPGTRSAYARATARSRIPAAAQMSAVTSTSLQT